MNEGEMKSLVIIWKEETERWRDEEMEGQQEKVISLGFHSEDEILGVVSVGLRICCVLIFEDVHE